MSQLYLNFVSELKTKNMKKIDRNYSQLERRILETANGQIFIDKTVLLGKVLKMPENTGITEADVDIVCKNLPKRMHFHFIPATH